GNDAQGRPTGCTITIASVTDGTSNTILIGETLCGENEFQRSQTSGDGGSMFSFNNASEMQSIQPINWHVDVNSFTTANQPCCMQAGGAGPTRCIWNWHVTWGAKSNHSGGVNFAFADGSVHFVSDSIDHRTYQYLACKSDGQVVTLP